MIHFLKHQYPSFDYLNVIFLIVVLAAVFLWTQTNALQARWNNVPPVPEQRFSALSALGDQQLAYRNTALMLQNIGSMRGEVVPLKDYDYKALNDWFMVSSYLDEQSDAVPYLAAYYYGAGQNHEKISDILPYLYHVGGLPYPDKWKWLVHGAYLARHKVEDLDRALEFASKLASLDDPNIPIWAKQMPAFVHYEQGDKHAAYDIMKQILLTQVETAPADEVAFMKSYICDVLLAQEERQNEAVCE